MKTAITFGVIGLALYLAYQWLMRKRKEQQSTFEKPAEPRDQTMEIIRTPPVSTVGKQPWLTANLNPMYDNVASWPVVGQFLPKFQGQDSGSTPTGKDSKTFSFGSYVDATLNLAPKSQEMNV